MVTCKELFALYAVSSCITHAYPIHRSTEDSSPRNVLHSLATRSPNPRFKNPFDVNKFLNDLDYKIPDNKDIQEWVKEAQKKGAMAAAGDFPRDDDGDDDDDKDEDKDKDKKDDDDDDDEDKDEDDDKEDDDDDDKDESKKHKAKLPIQSDQPAATIAIASSTGNTGPAQTSTVYVPVPVRPTHFPNMLSMAAETTPLPIFPPPTSTVAPTDAPSPTVTQSPQDTADDPEVSESPVAQQPATEDSASETPSGESAQPVPSPSALAGLSQLLDLIPDDDQSEPSYR